MRTCVPLFPSSGWLTNSNGLALGAAGRRNTDTKADSRPASAPTPSSHSRTSSSAAPPAALRVRLPIAPLPRSCSPGLPTSHSPPTPGSATAASTVKPPQAPQHRQPNQEVAAAPRVQIKVVRASDPTAICVRLSNHECPWSADWQVPHRAGPVPVRPSVPRFTRSARMGPTSPRADTTTARYRSGRLCPPPPRICPSDRWEWCKREWEPSGRGSSGTGA